MTVTLCTQQRKNESTAGADASVEVSYNITQDYKKKPGQSCSYNVQRIANSIANYGYTSARPRKISFGMTMYYVQTYVLIMILISRP